jgi:hypothetical protein
LVKSARNWEPARNKKFPPDNFQIRQNCPNLVEKTAIWQRCSALSFNGRVGDKPRRLPRHQRAQAHNSTHYQHTLLLSAQFYVLAM